jgi:hypothetical protein
MLFVVQRHLLDALFIVQQLSRRARGAAGSGDCARDATTDLRTVSCWRPHMPEIANCLRYAVREALANCGSDLLVTLWAAIARFHFALALAWARYATSVMVFAWPALVAEIDGAVTPSFGLG